jgi:hypothetical protein
MFTPVNCQEIVTELEVEDTKDSDTDRLLEKKVGGKKGGAGGKSGGAKKGP